MVNSCSEDSREHNFSANIYVLCVQGAMIDVERCQGESERILSSKDSPLWTSRPDSYSGGFCDEWCNKNTNQSAWESGWILTLKSSKMLEKMSKMSHIEGGTVAFQAETVGRARALKPERLWCSPETWHCLGGVAEMSTLWGVERESVLELCSVGNGDPLKVRERE